MDRDSSKGLIVMQTYNSCKIGTSMLPDMYTRHPRVSVDLLGNVRVPVLQLICM